MEYEETAIVDLGDATVETKQVGPGSVPDSMFGWGVMPGSPSEEALASAVPKKML